MTTIAQQLKAECKSAADVMERADQMRAEADQDWDNETTTARANGQPPEVTEQMNHAERLSR